MLKEIWIKPRARAIDLAIVVGILGLLFSVVTYFLGKRSERNQERGRLVLQYYPDLIKNLRTSIPSSVSSFKTGYTGQFDSYFEVLLEMYTNGTLKIIESLDEGLYADLLKILDDFLPKLEVIQEERRESWKVVKEKWVDWLDDKNVSQLDVDSETFVQQVSSSIIWNLWRGNLSEVEKEFTTRVKNLTPETLYDTTIKSMILDGFRLIAENEWSSIKSEFELVNGQLQELIEKRILPKMEKTIFDLGN